MSRLLAIGDIHGHQQSLATMLNWIRPERTDTIVTLGDYVAKGPDSKGVIDTLIRLQQEVRLIPLLGNHELMMLWAAQNKAMYQHWFQRSGASVIASYGRRLKDVPAAHWDFLNGCHRYYETEHFIFVHASVDPEEPMTDQTDGQIFWQKINGQPIHHISGKWIVCGHTPQRSGAPLQTDGLICLDTDIKRNGWLTCLDMETGQYWQTNPKGERRTALLRLPVHA